MIMRTEITVKNILESAKPNLRTRMEKRIEIVEDVVRAFDSVRKEILFANTIYGIAPAESVARWALTNLNDSTNSMILGYAVSIAMEMIGFEKDGRAYSSNGYLKSACRFVDVEFQDQD